jgi:hypothetical protein
MIEKLSMVKIGERKFPIKCNIDVLAAIQDEFDNIADYEQKIIGLRPKENADGSVKMRKAEDGTESVDLEQSYPSVKAIAFSLPLMVSAGIEQAIEQGDTIPSTDWRKGIKDVDFEIIETALALYTEFERCFRRKKSIPRKSTTQHQRKKVTEK